MFTEDTHGATAEDDLGIVVGVREWVVDVLGVKDLHPALAVGRVGKGELDTFVVGVDDEEEAVIVDGMTFFVGDLEGGCR